MHYLALCCIVKDETPFLKEWITYHSLLGVEHFYVYDNMSKIPVDKVLFGFVPKARLTVRRLAGTAVQLPAYKNCLDDFGPQCRWIAFLDLDEFLVPLHDDDLRIVLAEFEPYAGLVVPWRIFTSNGRLARPKGPVIGEYTRRCTEAVSATIHVKSVVDPARALEPITPHHFTYKPGGYHVDGAHFPVPPESPFAYFPAGGPLQINHYYYRSQQDYEAKISRGRSDVLEKSPRPLEAFYAQTRWETVEDTSVLRFLPALLRTMGLRELPEIGGFLPKEQETADFMATAMNLLNLNKPEQAAVCLGHAAARNPGHAGLWVMRATVARRMGNPDRAERLLREAMRLAYIPLAFQELVEIRKAQNRRAEAETIEVFARQAQLLFRKGTS